ncbi:MAG: EamA family transporter [Candidatus Omnitrophota bacterium]
MGLFGIAGIALVSSGAYLLNIKFVKYGLLAPIKNVYREKGSMLMIIVALIYGATSVLGKKAVLLSGPLSFAAVYYGIFFVIFTPLALVEERKSKIKFEVKDAFLFLGLGVSFAAAMLFHFNAVLLTKVPYMISVKRLSLIISVLYGGVIFHEKDIGARVLGSLVMLCGVLILSLVR